MEIVAKGKVLPSTKDMLNIIITFLLVSFAWIFFRAENLEHAFSYISGIFSKSLFSFPKLNKAALATLILIAFLLIIEWIGREENFAIERFLIKRKQINSNINKYIIFLRWIFYAFIILLIGLFMQTNETLFIYFQF